jgi:hypothetical protein
MRENENVTAITIVLNAFIIVMAGHGIAPIGLLICFWFPYVDDPDFKFAIFQSYQESVGVACLFSCLGNLVLISSMFVRDSTRNKRVIIIGLILLFMGFFYLTHCMVFRDTGALTSFLTGIPFLISSFVLIAKLRIEYED